MAQTDSASTIKLSISPVSASISNEEMPIAFGDAKILSKLHLSSEYHQAKMNSKSKSVTAVVTYMGFLQYTRMPFDLSGALSTFLWVASVQY